MSIECRDMCDDTGRGFWLSAAVYMAYLAELDSIRCVICVDVDV